MDRLISRLPALVGVGMIVVAALNYLPDAVAIVFAVFGAASVLLGSLHHRLVGPFKASHQGLEANIIDSRVVEAVVGAADETSPEVSAVVRQTMGTINPATDIAVYTGGAIDPSFATELEQFKHRLDVISDQLERSNARSVWTPPTPSRTLLDSLRESRHDKKD